MDDRRYAPREQWERLTPRELTAPQLREGANRAHGEVEVYRLQGFVGPEEQTLELLWIADTGRAAVASARGVFWTNAPTPEAALQRWATGTPQGERTRPR